VSIFVFSFFFIGFLFCCCLWLRRTLLSAEFLFALFKELPFEELGAGWSSRGESMLPFIGRPLRPKSARSHFVVSFRISLFSPVIQIDSTTSSPWSAPLFVETIFFS
jgi:hypothetical protein